MRKHTMAAAAAAVCTAMIICSCGSAVKKEEETVFTGETTEAPAWQAKLDHIFPEAYRNVNNLDLAPGTYISVIGKESGSAYWKQVRAGVKQAADDLNAALGYTGEDKIRVLYNAPSIGTDVDEQVNILDEELARYPDVIAISSIDVSASSVQFDLATENGIPIVAFDSGNEYMGIQSTCKTDNAQAAAQEASVLCEAIGDSGEVVLLVHDSISENAQSRVQGFEEEIASEHPDVTVADVIYMDQLLDRKRHIAAERLGLTEEEIKAFFEEKADGQEDGTEDQTEDTGTDQPEEGAQQGAAEPEEDRAGVREEMKEKLRDADEIVDSLSDQETVAYYLAQHPEVKGCAATSVKATRLAIESIRSAGLSEQVSIMGFDGGKDQIAALEKEEIDGLVVQNPFGMGYAAVIAAARTVLEIGNEAEVNTGYIWVDRSNLDTDEVRGMLYD